MKQAQKILDRALNGLDTLGYRLEELGITDKVNRHNCMAFLFAEQQRLKGELDRLNVKLDTRKVQLDQLRQQAEQLAQSGLTSLLTPVRSTLSLLPGRSQSH